MQGLSLADVHTLQVEPRGAAPGRGALQLRAPRRRLLAGRWRWAAALRGSLWGSGGAGACPPLGPIGSEWAPGSPGRAPASASSRGPSPSPGSARTGARRPAAQDDIKPPPPARPAPPRGWGRGCVGRAGALGVVVPAPLKGRAKCVRGTLHPCMHGGPGSWKRTGLARGRCFDIGTMKLPGYWHH